MPSLKLIVNRKSSIDLGKPRKILLALRSLGAGGLLVLLLSGCSAVGTTKPAALQVTSTPEASIFLDGKHLGKTPFFSDQLKAGEYLLKIAASEASYVERILLTGGTLTVVNRELVNNFLAQSGQTLWLDGAKQGLFISSVPREADLTIDGRSWGQTPQLITTIEKGEHKIIVTKSGYLKSEFAIKTSPKYQLLGSVTLASEIAKGITPPSLQPLPQIVKVEIAKTPQGFLRVRKEPSLSASEIGRVKTGDQLEVIQETSEWIKVKFEDLPAGETSKQGWISAQYTKKLP